MVDEHDRTFYNREILRAISRREHTTRDVHKKAYEQNRLLRLQLKVADWLHKVVKKRIRAAIKKGEFEVRVKPFQGFWLMYPYRNDKLCIEACRTVLKGFCEFHCLSLTIIRVTDVCVFDIGWS